MGQSPLKLNFTNCKLESPEAFGDGMRQNCGPSELLLAGTEFADGSFSLGKFETNTKLKSFILNDFLLPRIHNGNSSSYVVRTWPSTY
jgi:hypothetical protein